MIFVEHWNDYHLAQKYIYIWLNIIKNLLQINVKKYQNIIARSIYDVSFNTLRFIYLLPLLWFSIFDKPIKIWTSRGRRSVTIQKIYSVGFCWCFPIDSARFRAQSGNGAFQSLGGWVLGCHTSLFSDDNFRRISRSSSYDTKFFYWKEN
jgi:hypothetical protein